MISLFNVIASIILIWVYNPKKDLYDFGEYTKKEYNVYGIPDTVFHRSLAKHNYRKELDNRRRKVDLSNSAICNSKKIESDNRLAYKDSSKIGSNNLWFDKKPYEHKYGKKSGLAKLDRYFEKKVFKKFDNINKLAEMMQNDKKSYKKKMYKKHVIPFILFSLLPFLGFTFLALFGDKDLGRGIIDHCLNNHDASSGGDGKKCIGTFNFFKHKETLEIIGCAHKIYICIMFIIVILVVIYIFIKLIKYERIRAGKGKMSFKEYYHFCKDVF